MIRGLYTAASGMSARQAQVDLIASNLANASTTGYLRDEALVGSFPQMVMSRIGDGRTTVVGKLGTGCAIDGVYTDSAGGAVHQTGNPLDLALQGNVFLAVRDGQGQICTTRNGELALDSNKRLITQAGEAVLGEINGQQTEIFVPGGQLLVSKNGSLSGAVDSQGRAVNSLSLQAKPNGATWVKTGDSLFRGMTQTPAPGYQVEQGFSEGSNVNPVEEMVRMIAAMRAYEANSKVIQVSDNTLDKLVNSVGNA